MTPLRTAGVGSHAHDLRGRAESSSTLRELVDLLLHLLDTRLYVFFFIIVIVIVVVPVIIIDDLAVIVIVVDGCLPWLSVMKIAFPSPGRCRTSTKPAMMTRRPGLIERSSS